MNFKKEDLKKILSNIEHRYKCNLESIILYSSNIEDIQKARIELLKLQKYDTTRNKK